MKNISAKIKESRIKKGLSQSELAEKLFITKQSISKYENSNSIPSKDIMEKLEKILEINLIDEEKSKILIIKRKYWIFVSLLATLLILVIVSLSVVNSKLHKSYDELEKAYNLVVSSNILDYSGVFISYEGEFETSPEDMRFYVDMAFTNPTSAPFSFDSDLVTVRIKLNDQSEVLELTSISENEQYLPEGSTFRTSIAYYLTAPQINSIEWFEIYYGDMFVGKEILSVD